LTTDVPYSATVEVGDFMPINGWQAPAPAPWLDRALDEIGDRVFGLDSAHRITETIALLLAAHADR
jgi:hypothetical protein